MTTHELTTTKQGEYHYTVGPYPVFDISPGDTVEVETHDAFEGASPGDALAITIERIEPRGPQPRGTTCPTSAASPRRIGRRCSTIRCRRS